MGDFKVFPYFFPQTRKIKCSLQTTLGTRYGNRVWNCSQFQHDRVLLRRAFYIGSHVAQLSLDGSRVVIFLNSKEAVEIFERQRNANASSINSRGRPSARRGPVIASVDRNVRLKYRCSWVLQFTRWCTISCCRSSSTHESSDPPFRVIGCVLSVCYTQALVFIILGSEESGTRHFRPTGRTNMRASSHTQTADMVAIDDTICVQDDEMSVYGRPGVKFI